MPNIEEKTQRRSLIGTARVSRVSPWDKLFPIFTRLLVWGIIFGILWLLGAFFPLIFLTFVFAYLQSSIVDWLQRAIPRLRTTLVILTGIFFLGLIIGTTFFIAPNVYRQAAGFAAGFSTYVQRMDAEILAFNDRYPILKEAIPDLKKPEPILTPQPVVDALGVNAHQPTPAPAPPPAWTFKNSPTGILINTLLAQGENKSSESVHSLLDKLANISGKAFGLISTFFLAFLFSFLIVLDLPHLTASVRELENTRLRFIYVEVADNIYQFGKVLGQTMQAQFYIALVNTFLTGIGIYTLGMQSHVAFLSVIVFLCSFIPVAGVIISSLPICLIALTTGGTQLMLASVALIAVIHIIEGYVLNPIIYGARLRINPVIVLIILTIGGKLFHVWGLILGVPVCTYIFGHAIRYDKNGNKRMNLFRRGQYTPPIKEETIDPEPAPPPQNATN